jgi:hypothetical protein
VAADDVSKSKPLRGGRQRANKIIVHRIEAGLWERQNLLAPFASVAEEAAATANTLKAIRTTGIAAAGLAACGVAYVGYKSAKTFFAWTEDVFDGVKVPSRVAGQVLTIPMQTRFLRLFGIGDGKGWI